MKVPTVNRDFGTDGGGVGKVVAGLQLPQAVPD